MWQCSRPPHSMTRRLSSRRPNDHDLAALTRAAKRWMRAWGAAGVVTIAFNARLSRSRGRAFPADRRIELRPDLMQDWNGVLETLCHELAHVAARDLFPAARAHGPEWAQLVQSAGYAARAQHVNTCRILKDAAKQRSTVFVWDHVCAICHMRRTAKRAVREWRCAECVAAGLPGSLKIVKRDITRRAHV